MSDIFIDFAKACQQAQKINEIGEEIKQLANTEFSETMQEISVAWKGENASNFLRKGEILQNSIVEAGNSVLGVAESISTVATILHEAEEKAKELAQSISSGIK